MEAQLTLPIGGAMSKKQPKSAKIKTAVKNRAAMKDAARDALRNGADLNHVAFWQWFTKEMEARGMSYRKIVAANGDIRSMQALQYAATHYGNPEPYFRVIADAFDMPMVEVLREAKLLDTIPEDVIVGDARLKDFVKAVSRASKHQLDAIITYQEVLMEKQGKG